ncbi:sensor histidine kinase [Luteococcus sp. OSA5]|uniref:sensor histidine kinase n=1 Tax=Luteococcus sp. OSA5 TaxID=3401630 RepID=UPI003B42D36B
MNRLSTRLVISHAVVALVAALTTYLVVRLWAPALFDQNLHQARVAGGGRMPGQGPGLRLQFAETVNRAVMVGGLAGVLVASLLAALLARRIVGPLVSLQRAARSMAAGQFQTPVPRSSTAELARLSDDVRSLGTQLAEAEARRVRLLGEFAHELRTPLSVANGYLEAMVDGVMPTDAERLTQVQDELRRVQRLGTDLSSLSRAEEGRLELRPQPVRLDEVAQRVVARLAPQADDAGVELVASGSAPPVQADPDRMAQVLTNLVGNALRATPPGGRITVTTDGSDAAVRVRVADTGEGLTRDDLDRIFERFYRVGRRADGGTGIGLTIARGIVEAHGGSLEGESEGLGRGAVFTVGLPR